MIATGTLAAATAGLVAPAAANTPPASTGIIRYATTRPVCPAQRGGSVSPFVQLPTARCYAMRLVPASRTTPGAFGYLSAAAPANQGPAGGLTPADLASAYGINASASVSQTVGIVDAYNDPNIQSDLAAFDSNYGLPCTVAPCSFLKVVGQTGSTLPPNDTTGWSVEETLDVEAVHSVCQKCNILLVEADDSTTANLDAAENEAVKLGATEISNSWGEPESGFTATDEAAFNHAGIPIFASAGDDGFDFFDLFDDISEPSAPASLPTVISVGGTSLYLTQTGTRSYELPWDSTGPRDEYQSLYGISGASGGGCSTLFTAPGWQASVPGYSAAECGGKRLDNDVAAVADPFTGFDVYDTYNESGWFTLGGTSLSSPVVAAIDALAGGGHGVKYPSLTLYGNLVRNPSSLYNVTIGGIGYCGGEGAAQCGNPNSLGSGLLDCDYPATGSVPSAGTNACDAAPGFNGPTGVGTPKGPNAFKPVNFGVITLPSTLPIGTSETFSASKSVDPYPGGSISSYSWTWGDGSATSTGVTASHTYTKAGTYTITLAITDSYGEKSGNSVKVTLGSNPTAVITPPASVTHGTAATFSGASSTDPNTDGKVVSYTWSWGDGTADTVTSSPTTSHTYAAGGSYTVGLTVKDNYGYSSTQVSTTVTVS